MPVWRLPSLDAAGRGGSVAVAFWASDEVFSRLCALWYRN